MHTAQTGWKEREARVRTGKSTVIVAGNLTVGFIP